MIPTSTISLSPSLFLFFLSPLECIEKKLSCHCSAHGEKESERNGDERFLQQSNINDALSTCVNPAGGSLAVEQQTRRAQLSVPPSSSQE